MLQDASVKLHYSKLCTSPAHFSALSNVLHTCPCIVKQQVMLTLSGEQGFDAHRRRCEHQQIPALLLNLCLAFHIFLQ